MNCMKRPALTDAAISGSFSEWSFRCPRPSLQCWCSIMAWLNGLIYLRDQSLQPLQIVLRNILMQNQVSAMGDIDSILEQQKAAELIKYGLIIVSTLPVLVVYPFLQKHFNQGTMLGSVKG